MRNTNIKSPLIALSAIIGLALISVGHTFAQDVPIAHSASDLYHGETAGSKSDLDYRPMDAILKNIVLVVGPSNRQAAGELELASGTRMQLGNPSRTRYEGNRILYHQMTQEDLAAIETFRMDLEAIPGWIDMARLSKNAQLAYWLNLYNLTLIEQIAKRYPVTDIERLRENGLWDEKLLKVNNIDLSLNDIQYQVLAHWNEPLVIYGLFQGAIGGPNIRSKAFRGATVMGMLRSNARDFVNSLRGVQFWGDTAKISVIYDRFKDKFPDGDEYIRAHIVQYANGEVGQRMRDVASIEMDVYDEHIADIMNGRLGGNSINTNAAGALGMERVPEKGEDGSIPMKAGTNTGTIGQANVRGDSVIRDFNLPAHAIDFMAEIARRNSERATSVTIEDVTDEEDDGEN